MNFLVLINGAPKYKLFFSGLGVELEKRGHTVFYAIDARRSTVLEPDHYVDNNAYYFTDFFKKNYKSAGRDVLANGLNSSDTWGDFLFSDYDRFENYKYGLNKSRVYWESVYISLAGFFDGLIGDLKINVVLYENVSNSFAYMAYRAASRAGAKYLGLVPSRLPGRYEIQNSIFGAADQVKKFFDEMDAPSIDEEEWADDYISSIENVQPDYMRHNMLNVTSLTGKYASREKLSRLFRVLKSEIVNRDEHLYSYQYGRPFIQSFGMVRRALRRRLRQRIVRRFYKEPISGRDYYIYPIHFHPESSTSVLAPNYVDEFENIKNIAFSLPMGAVLYVKDHMSAFALNSVDFYRKVSRIPNVVLIAPEHNIKSLMRGASGLITITGTAGFEAALLGCPVYCFGDVFYKYFRGVRNLLNYSDLKRHLLGEKKENTSFDNKDWLISYRRYTKDGALNIMSSCNDFSSICLEVEKMT